MFDHCAEDAPSFGPSRSLLAPVAPPAVRASMSDANLARHMLRLEAEAALAAAGLGVVPAEAGMTVAELCRCTTVDDRLLERMLATAESAGNPVVGLVEELRARVLAVDATAGVAVHPGLTSQDVLDTAIVLQVAEVLDLLVGELVGLGRSLASLSREHRSDPMCGRTLTQHALPITFGLKTAHWLDAVVDALRRVRRLRSDLPIQLGGPVGSLDALGARGADFVSAVAGALGLRAPVVSWHTDRQPVLDIAATLAAVAGVAAKIAGDVLVLVQPEVGEVSLASAGGSSSMPHKANPAQAISAVAAARDVPWALGLLAQSMAAENERSAGAWQAEWSVVQRTLLATASSLHWCALLVGDLEVATAVMRRRVEDAERLRGGRPGDLTRFVDAAQGWIDRVLARWAEDVRDD